MGIGAQVLQHGLLVASSLNCVLAEQVNLAIKLRTVCNKLEKSLNHIGGMNAKATSLAEGGS